MTRTHEAIGAAEVPCPLLFIHEGLPKKASQNHG